MSSLNLALRAAAAVLAAGLSLRAEFTASVAQSGVRIPLLVTVDESSGFRVVEGHRRLAAAVKAGLSEVPCIVDPERTRDDAGQFLDMLVANGRGYRKNSTLPSRKLRRCSRRRRPGRAGPGSARPPGVRPMRSMRR